MHRRGEFKAFYAKSESTGETASPGWGFLRNPFVKRSFWIHGLLLIPLGWFAGAILSSVRAAA
jgi:hypothetical protein